MARYNQVSSSGDGTRPTTSGGVDNIGAGEKFSGRKTPGGEVGGPAPAERMADKRSDVRNAEHDDLDALGIREEQQPESNSEPVPRPEEMPVNQPRD